MASAGGSLEAGDVSVRTSIVSAWARLPSADTPDTSPAAMKQQLTASFHDFAVSLGGRLDKRRELRDYSRDHRLRRIEYFRPDFLRYVLSHIAACHDGGFSQSKVLRTPDSFMPRLFKLIFDAPYQFVELLRVKA